MARKMYKALSPGAIGVAASNLDEALRAAKIGGFEGVEIDPSEVADLVERDGADAVRARFEAAGVKPAGWGLPVDWRTTEENWQAGLTQLPRLAKAAAAIGCNRTMTWVLPMSDERPLDENRSFHVARFKPIAAILAEYGVCLGLEFIGPKTLRDRGRYPFIYRMGDMLDLACDIGSNVGLLLDCWHWYTSGGTLAELRELSPSEIVYVHVNDAPAGVPVEEQLDNVRALPGETGVIPIAGFLQALAEIGYDGPVTPEPFKKELGDLGSDEERLRRVGESMSRIFALADLS